MFITTKISPFGKVKSYVPSANAASRAPFPTRMSTSPRINDLLLLGPCILLQISVPHPVSNTHDDEVKKYESITEIPDACVSKEAVFCLLSLRKISQSRFQCPSLRQWKHFLSSLYFLPTGLGATQFPFATGLGATQLPFAFLFLFGFPFLGLFPPTANTCEVLDFMYRGFMSLSNVLSIPKSWGMVLCMSDMWKCEMNESKLGGSDNMIKSVCNSTSNFMPSLSR